MNRKAFYHLLERYVQGNCTEEERKLVDQWYELLGDDEDVDPAMPPSAIKETLQRLWPKIQHQTLMVENTEPVAPQGKIIPLWARWVSAAVAVAGIVMAGYWFTHDVENNNITKHRPAIATLSHVKNNSKVNDTIMLHDGTTVVLEPGSALHYPQHFTGSKREVYLDGSAFFKVTKNPKAPFYVYNNNLVTQVLGTSFFVKTNPQTNNVEVSVRTGKVAVYEYGQETVNNRRNEESNGVILKPNQKVIYSDGDHHFRTMLIEIPLPVVLNTNTEDKITELNFVFEETPIASVLRHLEQAYHIEMVLENESLAKCLFSGDIKGQNLYDQLEIICESVQASYEIRGTRILIKGSGCEEGSKK